MQTQEFKKIGRQLRELYSLLKQEILDEGIDLLSPEYDTLLKIGQDKIREIVLARAGFTLEEYREAKARIQEEQKRPTEELKEAIEEVRQAKAPTKEEIEEIAKGVIPAPQVIQNVTQKTVNKIVRETIVEKPTVIRETVVKNTVEKVDTSELEQRVAGLTERLDALPENNFEEHFEKNIDTLGMPDFRKLAMGLQAQIDEVRATPSSGAGYTAETPSGTVDGSNVTFTVTATPVCIVSDSSTLFENFGYTLAGLTVTMDNAPNQFIRSFHS